MPYKKLSTSVTSTSETSKRSKGRMDRLVNKAFFVLFPFVVGVSIFTGWLTYGIAKDLRGSINNNQAQTVEGRKANADRQREMKAYIKCVVLLSKKYPDVNFPTLNLQQTEPYLDACAKDTSASEN